MLNGNEGIVKLLLNEPVMELDNHNHQNWCLAPIFLWLYSMRWFLMSRRKSISS